MKCLICLDQGWIPADDNPYMQSFINCSCNPQAISPEQFVLLSKGGDLIG